MNTKYFLPSVIALALLVVIVICFLTSLGSIHTSSTESEIPVQQKSEEALQKLKPLSSIGIKGILLESETQSFISEQKHDEYIHDCNSHANIERTNIVDDSIAWMAKQQNADGSFGNDHSIINGRKIDRTGTTALVMLSMLGSGYWHRSKDELDGVPIGEVMSKGLQWLMDQQDTEGSTSSDLLNNILVSLLISEIYGFEESNHFKKSAQKSVDYLLTFINTQENIDSEKNKSWLWDQNDPLTKTWMIMALQSADLAGLNTDHALKRISTFAQGEYEADPRNITKAYLHMMLDNNTTDIQPKLLNIDTEIKFEDQPFDFLFNSKGLLQYEGPRGKFWRKWTPSMKNKMMEKLNETKVWIDPQQQLNLIAIATLTMQTYYRYPARFPFLYNDIE